MQYYFGKDVSKGFVETKINWRSKDFVQTAKKLGRISDIRQKNCFVCGASRSKIVSSFYEVNYLQCLKCRHIYVNRRLSEEKLKKYYSEDENYSKNTYANKKLIQIRESVFTPKIKFVKKFTKKKRWLDVGAADGACVSAANKEGFSCKGIEISEHSRKFAEKYHKLELYPDSLEVFEKNNKRKWNIISFFGVLEHLPDPINALKLSNSLLEQGGLIAIEVPNYQSVSTYVQKLSKNPDRHLVPYTHIMMFTEESMKFALKKTGFKPIAFWYYGMDVIELLKYLSKNKNFKKSDLDIFLQNTVNKIQRIIDEEKRGDFFFVIAKKVNSNL